MVKAEAGGNLRYLESLPAKHIWNFYDSFEGPWAKRTKELNLEPNLACLYKSQVLV